jgi:endonuclease/exonuclease/phosphatase family metal-dependent hydrolase
MNQRIAFTLVPIAFLTLSCGQPVSFSTSSPPEPVAAEQSGTKQAERREQSKEHQQTENSKEKSAKKQPAEGGIKFGRRDPLPKKEGAIRLATYNVENLFDDKDDPTIPPPGSTITDDKTMHVSPARLAGLAAAIKRLDADVLALQEVESKDALVEFRDGYLKGLGYDHVASVDAGDPRGIEQSVLSRIPIVKVENWPEERIDDQQPKRTGQGWAAPKGELPKRWARSPLVVTLKTKDGYQLELFVVHHKSGGDFDAQRELEALEVIERVQARVKANPQLNIAVLGDFNATPTKKSIKTYMGAGFVNAYDKRFDPKAPSETYITHATHRPIDFIFMSPGLAKDTIDKSFFVFGTPVPEKLPDFNANAEEKEKSLPKGYASDHMPVVIDLVPRD